MYVAIDEFRCDLNFHCIVLYMWSQVFAELMILFVSDSKGRWDGPAIRKWPG